MQYSENLKLNLPERNDQFNLEHWNENTNNLDELIYQNQLNISQNQNDISEIFEGLGNKNVEDTNSVYYKLMKLIYPVGCLYWSSNNTNPSELFGGTWSQIKDKFILSAGDTYSNNDIGGSATVTLTVAQMPVHTHTMAEAGSHSHTTNTLTNLSGTAITSTNKQSSNPSFNGSHTHNHAFTMPISRNSAGNGNNGDYFGTNPIKDYEILPKTQSYDNTLFCSNETVTISGTTTGDHTHNFEHKHSTDSKGSHNHTINNAGGSNGTTQGHNNMPPYVVKYCWERTA